MHSLTKITPILSLTLALASVQELAAQDSTRAISATGQPQGTYQLIQTRDEIIALAARYKACFEAGGFRISAAVEESSANHLEYALEQITIDGAALLATKRSAAPLPEAEGDSVLYRHRGGIDERYLVRGEEIEQVFLFRDLPATRGEIVVRGRIRTPLQRSPADAAGSVRFASEGTPVLRWGHAMARDAAGSATAVETRFSEDAVELVIPAEFVRRAVLPLELDPPIGPTTLITGTPTKHEHEPAVAYSDTRDTYLVAWTREYGQYDDDVFCRLLSREGNPTSQRLNLEVSSNLSGCNPDVAWSRGANAFLVVWEQFADGPNPDRAEIWGCYVNPSTGAAIGNKFVIQQIQPYHTDIYDSRHPVAGGDPLSPGGFMVAYLRRYTIGDMDWASVVSRPLPGPGGAVGATVMLEQATTPNPNSRPAISSTCGAAGRYMVVWEHEYSSTDQDIAACIVSRGPSAAKIGATFNPGYTSRSEAWPSVDGDGNQFLIAWQVPSSSGNDDDIIGELRDSAGGLIRADFPIASTSEDEDSPSVAVVDYGYAVAFRQQGQFMGSRLMACTINGGGATIAAPQVMASGHQSYTPDAAANLNEGTFLFAYVAMISNDAEVYVQRYAPLLASATRYGSGCSWGGGVPAIGTDGTLPFPGNRDFRFTLEHAPANAPSMLLFGASRSFAPSLGVRLPLELTALSAPGCFLRTDLVEFSSAVASAGGSLALAFPMPPDFSLFAGQSLYFQWLTMNPGAGQQFSVSNALELSWTQ